MLTLRLEPPLHQMYYQDFRGEMKKKNAIGLQRVCEQSDVCNSGRGWWNGGRNEGAAESVKT